ncbi:MAG: nucleoside hydrolase [Gammaproteobacteria bacterium]|nr:nucleoside hydrolase [Gammaproteobacteria bacterium]
MDERKPEEKPKMIIDCDPGHDDAVAIIFAHMYAEVLGVTTVSGNAPLESTTRNALSVIELLDVDTPVHSGASAPLVGKAIHAAGVHGPGGLGGVDLGDPSRTVASRDAVQFLLTATRAQPDVWIVAIGPLTNIALALQEDPTLTDRITGISIMGGSATVGNATRVAEFNIWADPEAADVVFRSGAKLLMAGLNLTHQFTTSDALVEQLREIGSSKSNFVAALFDFMHGRMEELIGKRTSALHDPCAVLALTHPELIASEPRAVVVELDGTHTRGMTVVDERVTRRRDPANVEVAYSIDADRAMALVVESVRR